jgi:serine/threonine protein kinase
MTGSKPDTNGTPSWTQIKELFGRAVEVPPAERAAWLEKACNGDQRMREELVSLLEHDDPDDTFLERAIEPSEPGRVGAGARSSRLDPGNRVKSWTVIRKIGAGGMGEVYLAERLGEDDPSCKQLAAIKLIKSSADIDRLRKRFKAERRIVAGLNHPSIARLLESGVLEDGTPYFALDYVEGQPIDQYCKRLDVEKRLQIFCQICEAVAYAHKNLIVHCDLKPSNILVSSDGIPHLLDFGIARFLAEAGENGYHTQTLWPCSLRYSSPEQIRNEAVTTATDIFALGIILCELATGVHPFDPEATGKAFDIIERIYWDEPRIRIKRSGMLGLRRGWQARQFDAELALIIRKALNRRPDDRYANVGSLSGDVQRCLDRRPISIKGHEFLYRVQKLIQRHPGTTSASAVAALLGIAAIFLTLWLGQVAQRETKYAQERAALADTLINSGSGDRAPERATTEKVAGDSTKEIWDYDSALPVVSPSGNYAVAKEIAKTLESMVERWNAKDMEGYLDFCWKSPRLVSVGNGALLSGWQEVHDHYTSAYSNRDLMGHTVLGRIQVRLIGPDNAYAIEYWSVDYLRTRVVGMDTNYLQRFEGVWKITMTHSTESER